MQLQTNWHHELSAAAVLQSQEAEKAKEEGKKVVSYLDRVTDYYEFLFELMSELCCIPFAAFSFEA